MKPKSFSAARATTRDKRNCSMKNVAHGGACAECTSNCMLHHRNHKDPNSSVERFFRIMLGTDFSEVVFVPVVLACKKKWRTYIDREACLEDTIGEKYTVKISEVDNAVAFKEGWCRFSADHQLEEGDFLIFNHFVNVEKLHFIVHVFGRSGLEKKFFSRGHDKKVPLPTMNRNAALLNKTLEVGVMSSVSKNSPAPSVVPEPLRSDIHHDSRTINNTHGDYSDGKMLQQAEPAPWCLDYMLPRDDLCIEDRTCLYDLSSFEHNDHPAASVVSIGNDESGTINHEQKTIEPQSNSDLLDMFPLKKKKSSNPEPQLYKKQNGIIDLDLQDTLPVKRKFSGQEQPYKKQNVPIENNNGSPAMKMTANDGVRFNTHVPKMINRRDIFGPADNIPVQRDVSGSKTPSCKAMLDNKKNVDSYGSASNAQDKTQKVSTGGIIASAPPYVTPLMQMAARDGEKSKTHELKMIQYQDRDGPAETINVQREVSLVKTSSHKAKLIKKNDMSGPDSSAQYTRQTVATGGGAIKTIKKELDLEDDLFCHQQSLNVKKQTISPENVRRCSSKIKTNVKIPKAEPFFSERISSTFVGMESSSAEVEDKPYLLLQSELPSVLSPREKLRTIYLRAKDNKVLPVTYLQKNGVRVLTSGWQLFKSMNHLHAGDRCRIELEDASKRIYRFEVLSRGTVMNLK